MRISLNWLKEYTQIDLDPEKVSEILTDIGLEVEGMERFESLKGGLKGVVVGEVKTCVKHPNADKLSLTTVDVGTGALLQIVCGAPNVAKGQKVFVATEGTTLYPLDSDNEPLLIKKGKIRGEVSEGMICAEDELGIGRDHSGIMVLPEDTKIGLTAGDYFKIEQDYVYEIGLTPNRSDATNHLGVARDIAAALKMNYGHPGGLNLPDVSRFKINNKDLPIEVVVENPEGCPRYVGVSIQHVTIGESPEWLKNRLKAVGVRPINNIVDITNFVLHELGQPLHAFDLDRISKGKVIVKTLKKGQKFISLDSQERTLSEEDLMICDGESNGMCIGGVFGGLKSGVTETTKNIFLESAHFHPKWIRRTSMRHNLRTDAAKVFEKGSDPNISLFALKRAALLIQELAGGQIASEITDFYPAPIAPKQIEVRYERINRLIGTTIAPNEVKSILEAMDMKVEKETKDQFTVHVPTNKSDVIREVDVIEEILRIYGFNKVPIPNKINTSIAIAEKPDPSEIKNIASEFLSSCGLNEMMALSLSESRYFGEDEKNSLIYINNTSNLHLDIMRPNMLLSGLETILHNQNRQQQDIKLFEFGNIYFKDDSDKIIEEPHLSILLSGSRWKESWVYPGNKKADYFLLKSLVENLLKRLGGITYQESILESQHFSYGLKFHRGKQVLVEFGKVNGRDLKKMDVKGDVFFADFYWTNVLQALKNQRILVKEPNKFPSMRRDLALVVENSVNFSDIVTIARKVDKQLLKNIDLFDVYVNEKQLGTGKKSYAVSFSFEDDSKTLKDNEVDKIMDKLIKECESQLGALIRR